MHACDNFILQNKDIQKQAVNPLLCPQLFYMESLRDISKKEIQSFWSLMNIWYIMIL